MFSFQAHRSSSLLERAFSSSQNLAKKNNLSKPEIEYKIAFDHTKHEGQEGILYYNYDSKTLEVKYILLQFLEQDLATSVLATNEVHLFKKWNDTV